MEKFFGFLEKIHFSVQSVASFVLFLVSMFVAVMISIFFFHWKKYAMGGFFMVVMELVYLSICVTLLGAAFFSLS